MLHSITLDGFRCFEASTPIALRGLTVLAGANSVGKSSVIHALMALTQSSQQQSANLLRLSGDWVEVGSFQQTVSYGRSGAQRHFSIGAAGERNSEDFDVVWTFVDPEDPTADVARVQRVDALLVADEYSLEASGDEGKSFRLLRRRDAQAEWTQEGQGQLLHPGLLLVTKDDQSAGYSVRLLPYEPSEILYLGAFRHPPQKIYQGRRSGLGPLLGAMGEYTAETLLRRQRTMVDVLPGEAQPAAFGAALNAWWSHIFDRPYSLRVEVAQRLGFTLSLDTPSAENLGLGQVGLGLSQALPVVTLGLCSKREDVVVIESPEIHLHPAAQHRLCDLFVALVRAGRQVVLETHSDHLINAIRLAVKRSRAQGGLDPDQVAIHYFGQEEGVAKVEEVPIDKHGRLEKWPTGFFDQSAQALLELIR